MNQYKLTKNACYLTSMTMAISANLSPLLFLTFKDMYNLSYTMLGFLVVINFFTQLFIDLIFTFFTKHFNIHKAIRNTPLIVFIGLILYAILPRLFPDMAFLWIVIGTVIFSVASGLSEVLISPVIAAIPSENPEREMSKLHSMYAWRGGSRCSNIKYIIFVRFWQQKLDVSCTFMVGSSLYSIFDVFKIKASAIG